MKIKIQFFKGLKYSTVHWPAVPRIGDDVEFNDGDKVTDSPISGEVRTVVWWGDGSVRVVLR